MTKACEVLAKTNPSKNKKNTFHLIWSNESLKGQGQGV